MNRAAGAVGGQLGEIQHLGDDALTGKGRIAMDEQGDDRGAAVVEVELVCMARATPSRTPSAASRWEGLAAR